MIPKHYEIKGLGIESIRIVEAVLEDGEDIGAYKNYCLGNILKYAIRCKKKGQFRSDIEKIKTYCDFILEQS